MQGPQVAYLTDGRLHLHHGPIDLIIGADGSDTARRIALEAAANRFQGLLEELVAELPELRRQLCDGCPPFAGAVARRMVGAAMPFSAAHALTPMIAVAGSVADEILTAMRHAAPLARAYVNNGGDIAVHLSGDARYSAAMAGLDGTRHGTIGFHARAGIGGIATSGAGGRSLSFGIADGVTVLARDAATADTAATLIANAVDLPDHPGIRREPAEHLQPDSDLGARLVVTHVPEIPPADGKRALARGAGLAAKFRDKGQIVAAALFLQGQSEIIGDGFAVIGSEPEVASA